MVALKSAELRKWADRNNVNFKTTSEIERERSVREREQDRSRRDKETGRRKIRRQYA